MKKSITLTTAILLILTLCLSLCACTPSPSPEEDFEYEVDDGEIEITGYKGEDSDIIIPDTIDNHFVTKIEDNAFEGYNITSVVIPDTVTKIDNKAFRNCKRLKEVEFGNSLEEIDYKAFYGCISLTSVHIPESVTDMKNSGFGIADGEDSECVIYGKPGSAAEEYVNDESDRHPSITFEEE